MKSVRTLFLSTQTFFFSALMGLFLNDPLILPEFGSYDDWDKHNNGSNVIVLNDRGLNIIEPDAFIKNLRTSVPESICYILPQWIMNT